MIFEYDKDKSKANKDKHGIGFEEAQSLWQDNDRIELPSKRFGEERFLAIGMIKEKHWTAIITYRNENIRIISVRRSHKKEVEAYESN